MTAIDAMAAAVEGGAKVVVCAGYLQEAALRRAAIAYPDVHFVFIDGYAITEDPEDAESAVLTNVAGISLQGRAVRLPGRLRCREGRLHRAWASPAAAAAPTRPAAVTATASCRAPARLLPRWTSTSTDELLLAVRHHLPGQPRAAEHDRNGWYTTGTEIVFACGGSMFASPSPLPLPPMTATSSAWTSTRPARAITVVTSAMKGIDQAAQSWPSATVYDGTWDEIGGKATTLGADGRRRRPAHRYRQSGASRPSRSTSTTLSSSPSRTAPSRLTPTTPSTSPAWITPAAWSSRT